MPSTPLRIGVMFEAVQLSDIMGIDVFGNLSVDCVEAVKDLLPENASLKELAIPITWYFISSSLEPAATTALPMKIVPNTTYDDCPRDLDIVIIGGPLITFRPAAADKFMKEAWNSTRVWLTTCIGSMWLASTGLLDGRKCTTNRLLLPHAKQLHPGVNWQDKRWIVDEKPYTGDGKGELWTSGAAGTGKRRCSTLEEQEFTLTVL